MQPETTCGCHSFQMGSEQRGLVHCQRHAALPALLEYIWTVKQAESDHACLSSPSKGYLKCCEVCTKINAAGTTLDRAFPNWREWV